MLKGQIQKKGVNSCIKLPMILSEEQNHSFIKAPLERGLEYRALCDTSMIEDEKMREWMGQLVEWGVEVKDVETLPLKMQAFDDEVVLISMQDPANPKTYSAINPQSAFQLLAQERTAVLDRQRRETQTLAVQLAEELAPVFALGQEQNDPLAYVEVLSGQNPITYRAQSLAKEAPRVLSHFANMICHSSTIDAPLETFSVSSGIFVISRQPF